MQQTHANTATSTPYNKLIASKHSVYTTDPFCEEPSKFEWAKLDEIQSHRLHNQTWPTTQSESHITPTGRAGRNGPPPTKVSFKRSDMPSKVNSRRDRSSKTHTLEDVQSCAPGPPRGDCMALSSGGLLQIGECLLDGVRMEVTVAYTCVRKNYVVGWLILRFVFVWLVRQPHCN